MLLGIIKDTTNNIEYYINSEKKDNIFEISFVKVTKDNIKALSKEEIRSLLKTILSSNLTYKEKWNDYDVYLDEANNKRYFKNDMENFFMFLENNGVSAINYLNKTNKKPKTKVYSMVAATIAFEMILSSAALIPFAGDSQIRQRVDITVSSLIKLSTDELVNSLESSKYLTEEEKNILCNEAYFDFVLENTDSIRNYALRNSFDEIKIKSFENNETNTADGYYDPLHPNTIYVAENHIESKDIYDGIIIHEFIHMTQNCRYAYIREAADEICKSEYYNQPIISYPECVKRLKVLMEIIGPEPMKKCIYNASSNEFENTLKEYLTPEEVEDLLNLFSTSAETINDPNFDLESLNNQIDNYLAKIYYNKTGKDIKEKAIFNVIYNGNTSDRIYFNEKHENYNKDQYIGTALEFVRNVSIDKIVNSGNVESYSYSIKTTREINGDKMVYMDRKTVTNFSVIPNELTESKQIKIEFKDGTIGYVTYNKNTDSWGSVTQYRIMPPYEPSIPKKFPDQVKESTNTKTIPEKIESEAKSI